MSREIKFRAFDSIIGEMFQIQLDDNEWDITALAKGNGWNVMQYTGLKNVFESDIIHDHNGIGLVEYVDDKAAFRVNYKNGRAKWFIDYNLKGELESIEVIGNIYQSPELLEGKQ